MLTDFSTRRPKLWPMLAPEFYEVYEIGVTSADVREGSLQPTLICERVYYDWSIPGRVRWKVQESNFSAPGSYVEWNRTALGLKGNVLIALVVLTRGANIRRKVFQRTFDRAA